MSKMTALKNAKKIATASPALAVFSKFEFEPGLIVVAMEEPSLAAQVSNAFEQLWLIGSKRLGVCMPAVEKMLSLHTGSQRKLKQAVALMEAKIQFDSKVRHTYKDFTSHGDFNWLTDAGLCVLLPHIEETGCGVLTLTQGISGSITPSMSVALTNIGNAAKQAKTYVLLFLVCIDGMEKLDLHELCDEYIKVGLCEPDIGCQVAFSVEFVGLRDMHLLGVGKTMCQVKTSERRYLRRYRPFIASDCQTRAMWIMRREGKTLEEIGKLLGIHKSNVLRRLKGLPKHPRYKVEEGWTKRYLDATSASHRDASPGSDYGNDAEEVDADD